MLKKIFKSFLVFVGSVLFWLFLYSVPVSIDYFYDYRLDVSMQEHRLALISIFWISVFVALAYLWTQVAPDPTADYKDNKLY